MDPFASDDEDQLKVSFCCGSEMIFSDPDPTFQLVPDPDPVSDPT